MSLGDIKRLFARQFGGNPRSAEKYYTIAKREMIAELGINVNEMRGMSAEFYFRIAGNPNLPEVIRMRARENLDRLFGLHAPIKTAQTTTSGSDIPPARTTQHDREEFLRLVEAARPTRGK